MSSQTTSEGLPLAANIFGFGVAALVGGRAFIAIVNRLRHRQLTLDTMIQTDGYEDCDGIATPQSIKEFSDKPQRVALAIGIGLGVWLSLSEVVVFSIVSASTGDFTRWMRLGAWGTLALSTVAVWMEDECTLRFRHGLQTSIGCVAMMVLLVEDQYRCYEALDFSFLPWFFLLGQCCAALGACMAGASLPRRPDVFRNGTVVDRKGSTTFLDQLFFGWVGQLFSAGQKDELEISHLPELEYNSRSPHLFQAFSQPCTASSKSLWRVLLFSHRKALFIQLVLTFFNGTMAFVPQLFILGILQRLETDPDDPSLWLFVLGLGASTIVSALIENWNLYVSSNLIAVRLQEQLSTVIYDKALRCRAVNNVGMDSQSASTTSPSSQGTMNLVAVDAKKVADFSALGFHLYEAPLKLIIAALSIGRLLGPQCLLVGGLVLLLVSAGNFYSVSQFSKQQRGLLRSRDSKMGVINEVLQGIRQVKLSALEEKWEGRINESRGKELHSQWQVFKWELLMFVAYNITPVAVSAACLGTYALLHDDMPASLAFTSVSLLGALETPLAVLPQILLNATGAQISLRRIERFLRTPDRDVDIAPADGVVLDQATICWNGNQYTKCFSLKDMSLTFPYGALSIITGPSGSGKSLVLAAILGECEFLHGSVRRSPSLAVAYVAQEPCLKDGTIRDNILYGLPFQQERYRRVLSACSLNSDMDSLMLKDETPLDDQGSNLSGGQKWRISLARALYSDAEIIVLDDIFSSIDSHTAQHLYQYALTGSLAEGRTRILATYHLELCLPRAEYVVALDTNGLQYAGPRQNLRDMGIFKHMAQAAAGVERASHMKKGSLVSNVQSSENWIGTLLPSEQEQLEDSARQDDLRGEANTRNQKWRNRQRIFRLTDAKYLCLLVLLLHLSYGGLAVGRGLWMMIWSNSTNKSRSTEDMDTKGAQSTGVNITWFLSIYLLLSICSCIVAISRSFLTVRITLKMSRRLFEKFLSSVLRAPLQWLDQIPAGNILNNFSADFSLIDSRLPYDLNYALGVVFDLLSIVLAASLVNVWLNLLSACSLLLAFYYGQLFIKKIRAIKELESTMRSPVLHHLCATMDRIMTIRAYRQEETHREEMYAKIDRHCRASWCLWLLTRWIAVRASTIGAAFTTAASILVLSSNGITASTAGFAITFIMRYSGVMSQVIRQYANLEISLNSVERVSWSLDIPAEKYESTDQMPESWPADGQVDVSDLTVCYSPDLPPVLSGLSFSIPPNTRVGVVGRTGAGKSSLAMALFRFLEAQQGSIHVAGVDISTIPLRQLRTHLAIVPQDPILFSGTIRSNLDPFDEHSDQELLSALRRVHWTIPDADQDENRPGSPLIKLDEDDDSREDLLDSLELQYQHPPSILSTAVTERGANFSQGQRQCLCLARAILRRPKVLVLDEATSAIDKATDAVIQRSIRTEFGHNESSLLVIAHRISTIIDFDRVLVLDAGRVIEYGAPQELVSNQNGIFRSLVESSVERDELLETMHAAGPCT
ncbi:ABC transporter family protein [Aspergillus eucalypticola CBS 122712]|uniref:ABC transporter family protein n=1 Tax=Aspergillus eucalypticola (strain CBS 122712 / IBT 29274) TaxID=1448314 RepID=A0A317WGC2_ASPEC|nr:ABC transporter family protein [Aspergillus eucalypticola CBS 122712]PWY84317.1 ABC transporter family protein [Aspergillus eucalypticola CBS 122712]